MVNVATFIISTGRCGTQWIATTLADAYRDRILVKHEPLHSRYDARQVLAGSSTLPNLDSFLPPDVLQHMDKIADHLERSPYIECGHPSWSTIPYLAKRFQGRVRIIHLTRHPVPTCYSWLTHGAFQKPLLPHIPEKILLSPFDRGIRFTEYQQRWEQLIPFEKCLFYWSEVNAFALNLQTQLDVPWLRLRYEDLFGGDGLELLLEFLELPLDETMPVQTGQVIDQYRYISPVWQDWRIIQAHPQALSICQQFGYTLNTVDEIALYQRYLQDQ